MYMFTIFYIINSLKLSSIINLQKYEINQYGVEKVLLVADRFVDGNAVEGASVAANAVDRKATGTTFSISTDQASGIVGSGIGEVAVAFVIAVDEGILFTVGISNHAAELKFP